jgi:hypothetical protein
MDTDDPFLAAVVTNGKDVVGVAHLGRRSNAHQQSALEWLYPTCAAEGCHSLTFLENDHRQDWAQTHTTVLDLLDRLCTHHHDLKTTEKWALVEAAAGEPSSRPKIHGIPATRTRHPMPLEAGLTLKVLCKLDEMPIGVAHVRRALAPSAVGGRDGRCRACRHE